MEAFFEELWQKVYAWLVIAGNWIFDKTDMTLQWMGKWVPPLYQEFVRGDFYILILLGGTIVIGAITIWMMWKIPWFTKKERKKLEEGSLGKMKRATKGFLVNWISLGCYILSLIWLIAMATAQEAVGMHGMKINGFMDMYIGGQEQISFFNFYLWFDPIKYAYIFVLMRFACSVVAGVFKLKFLPLLRFLLMTLECILLGLVGGLLISLVNAIAASGFIGYVVSIPVFFCMYTLPMVWIYTPPAIVAGMILKIMVSPFIGIFKLLTGGGGGAISGGANLAEGSFKITSVYTEVFSSTGKLLYTFFDFYMGI